MTPREASHATVYDLFRARARHEPASAALVHGTATWSYQRLLGDVDRVAGAFAHRHGITRGDRIAVVSENRPEYLVAILAAAKIGAIVACQNTRLADPELTYCLARVTPKLTLVSPTFAATMERLDVATEVLGIERLGDLPLTAAAPATAEPEDPLLLLYTSGTTGRPKGALISHRAEIARMVVSRLDLGIGRGDAHLTWSPLSHIGATDLALGSLMSGSAVILVNGFDPAAIVTIAEQHRLGWLFMVPGMMDQLADEVERRAAKIAGVRVVGCMLDLVAPATVARLSRLFSAPFLNSFGMTETGMAPLSGGLVPIGELPTDTSKSLSSLCDVRLLDPEGNDVADGTPGESAVRGPTVFSGYWEEPEANARDFATGYFRTGDLFTRTPRGTYIFVDRAKYMIKSGGENIYPAEIERVLLADPRVAEAVVVRRADAKWGEVPVAFIARRDETLTEVEVEILCRRELAAFKRPKDVRFVTLDEMPRSTSGKILRHEMEKRL